MPRFLRSVLLCLMTIGLTPQSVSAADLMSFWDVPRKGGNSFNAAPPDGAYFKALAATGATWVRLTFSKWKGEGRDFLIGDADRYENLLPEDLARLREVLDSAYAAGLKVVVVPLVLPGARWVQQNDGKFDDRLWSDPVFADQAVRFWRDLAQELKTHPAIAAYNVLNEPAPEKATGLAENAAMSDLISWQEKNAGGLRDLPTFYGRVIEAIRSVDPVTPVMVDSGYYANPRSLAAWPKRLADERVLYAFHMYEPYDATSSPNIRRKEPLRYPGVVTKYGGGEMAWDSQAVARHINTAFDWAKKQGLPQTRIVAGEFGCMRLLPHCGTYLTDVIDAIDAQGAHWAFYSFREDEWEGMDYELPPSLKPGRFYWLQEQGKGNKLPRDGKLMDLLRARMAN
ncbi:glycoside hydrolase family 5 protein [Nitratireductor sp. ZSWI3]|uniref:glycoside hydrolase family 5 protein n=1 Tax=Nitratireductor sp. ZSWI3 TaxID=2966359 RepID=UPI00214F7DA5|nr:glycoside hydrolase family 5 protein [Nitratireductor sp. ZSWI3]MCR4268579.1 glycoside hydrolase family 5 protein [Nitratireductor sp. ZSWI3]